MNSPSRSGSSPSIAIIFDCIFPREVGGAERVYTKMAQLMLDRGCQVTYLTRGTKNNPSKELAHQEFEKAYIWDGEIYDNGGVRTPSGAINFSFAVFKHLFGAREKYDIVISSSTPVLTLLAANAAKFGSKTILISDWVEVWGWRKWKSYSGFIVGSIAFLLQWCALKLTKNATVNSRFTLARVLNYKKSLQPIQLGLLDLLDEKNDASVTRSDNVNILFVGRHIADKQLICLPEALMVVVAAYPRAHLYVVGRGPETPRVISLVASLGLSDHVSFLGRVDDDQLNALFRQAHVLAHPSAREGFGLVVAEAASHGTPSVVVAGEDNAATELIETGINGFIAVSARQTDFGSALIQAIDGGIALRESTVKWFEINRKSNSLSNSVDQILKTFSKP